MEQVHTGSQWFFLHPITRASLEQQRPDTGPLCEASTRLRVVLLPKCYFTRLLGPHPVVSPVKKKKKNPDTTVEFK